MNGILDDSLVGLTLLVSAGYALSSLGPRSVRRRLLAALSRVTARAPGLTRASQRLAAASSVKAHGACGGCDGCGEEPAAQKSTTQNSRPGEVKVPLAQIGRRT